MGPQLYRCGNQGKDINILIESDMLQWGRNFIVAETERHDMPWMWY